METENTEAGARLYSYPQDSPEILLHAACVQNPDGSICYLLANAGKQKEQVQISENGELYYAEILPDTVCTVVFEP